MEVVAGRLGHLSQLPLASAPMVEPVVVGFVDEVGDELFGSFSPHDVSGSTPPVLLDFEGEASVEVVSPVLKIMLELQVFIALADVYQLAYRGQVMPVSEVTIEPGVTSHIPSPYDPFTKELCDLLVSVEVTRPGLGRSIACLPTGTKIRGKCEKVGKGKKSGAIGKMYVVV
ncbi:putative LRR receptor-like serine/threonine-protein kinase [Hordeum vulgare]|nr:putative LRR receptor-like serine/threonine-protein kinase [Hordeum vulgare]